MPETTITAPLWALSTRLAQALGISSTQVLPMAGLDHLFDAEADFYIWPPAGARAAIVSWLEANGCAYHERTGTVQVIIARGADVQRTLPEVQNEDS